MKITVEISDRLLREAKAYAARHGIALREVFERDVGILVEGARGRRQQLRLRPSLPKAEEQHLRIGRPFDRSLIKASAGDTAGKPSHTIASAA